MLVYRLIHFKDPIPDIDIGLDGRDKELCKPIIQLFNNKTDSEKEIRTALLRFLNAKNQKKGNLIEAALHPIIVSLVSIYGREISAGHIWRTIVETLEGSPSDEKKPNEYQSADYGTLYRNTITNIICDKFGAERRHSKNGSILIFDLEKLLKVGKVYDLETNIQTKVTERQGDGGYGSDGSTEGMNLLIQNRDVKSVNSYSNNYEKLNNIESNTANTTTQKDSEQAPSSQEPSQLSQPSPSSTTGLNKSIYRLGHSDTWCCNNCRQKGDKWYMQQHLCKGLGGK